MNLLKIGMLNIPQDRWEDALDLFDKIYVFTFDGIESEHVNPNFIYIKFNKRKFLNRIFFRIYKKTKLNMRLDLLNKLLLFLLRLANYETIKMVKNLEYKFVHSSYSDWDDSGLLTLLIYNEIKHRYIVRAFKETRPGYNFDEKYSIKVADKVVLNNLENKEFLLKKYDNGLFDEKEVIFGIDEDYRKYSVVQKIYNEKKMSSIDEKKHVVILAGRVFSDISDMRSGSRLFYISMIEEFIKKGFIVHLDTLKIFSDSKGINQYDLLLKRYPDQFIIENPSDFKNDKENAYSNLSKYDYGILHNFISGTSVSEFDKVNIPNRFYEYQIANVIPIVKRGTTISVEKMMLEKKCGVVYGDLEELKEDHEIEFYKPTFKEYISTIYENLIE